ncbi:3-oxoacyl-reductase [Pilobolus umbonatus]|nr:3-oxoacyl-reductase [Pilobolus umbonatus]
MSLAQKTAIITGATRGIGLCIAETFAGQGARIILIGQNSHRVQNVETTFRERFQQDHEGVVMDISKKEDIDTHLKQIDFLINAAGISKDGLLVQMKDDDLLSTINTNLLGTMRVTQQVAKSMIRKRQGGCIINISSVVGIHGNIGQSAYSASKGGVIAFTKSLAKELGPSKIRVNAIAPGYIDTDMTSTLDDTKKSALLQAIPLQRFGTVEDIALAALFIAQSEYIHGEILKVDGGLMI